MVEKVLFLIVLHLGKITAGMASGPMFFYKHPIVVKK